MAELKRAALCLLVETPGEKGPPSHVWLGKKHLRSVFGAGLWAPPGGMYEPGENGRMCAARETHEEMEVWPNKKMMHLRGTFLLFADQKLNMRLEVWMTKKWRHGVPRKTESFPEVKRFPVNALPQDMVVSNQEWLPAMLCDKKFDARIFFQGPLRSFQKMERLNFGYIV